MLRKPCESCSDESCKTCKLRARNRKKADATRQRNAAKANEPTPQIEQNTDVKEPELMPENKPTLRNIALKDLILDKAIQPRDDIDNALVSQYADDIEGGANFPPVRVFDNGVSRYLSSGFHRFYANQKLGKRSISCLVFTGSFEDAWLDARSDNKHGKHFTNEEKNRIAREMLTNETSKHWSDRRIALHVGVSQPFVSSARAKLSDNGYQMEAARTVVRGGKEYTQDTSNIGKTTPESSTRNDATEDDDFDDDELEIDNRDALEKFIDDAIDVDGYEVSADDEDDAIARILDSAPHDPNGVYVETKTEVINGDLPAPVASETKKLSKADERDLTDAEWLETLPLWAELSPQEHEGRRFKAAALAYRTLQENIDKLQRDAKRYIDDSAPDEFPERMRMVRSIAHPRDWVLCRTCKGTLFFEGAACSCKGGYRLW